MLTCALVTLSFYSPECFGAVLTGGKPIKGPLAEIVSHLWSGQERVLLIVHGSLAHHERRGGLIALQAAHLEFRSSVHVVFEAVVTCTRRLFLETFRPRAAFCLQKIAVVA